MGPEGLGGVGLADGDGVAAVASATGAAGASVVGCLHADKHKDAPVKRQQTSKVRRMN